MYYFIKFDVHYNIKYYNFRIYINIIHLQIEQR